MLLGAALLTAHLVSAQTLISVLVFLALACPPAQASVPRPEHPRPDAFRPTWLSLNGRWQFEIDREGDGESRGLISGNDLASSTVVPFCPESKLSGLGFQAWALVTPSTSNTPGTGARSNCPQR